jgi:hypothetical protein
MADVGSPDDAGDCFFAIRGNMAADPETITRGGQAVKLTWSATTPGGCPQLEWLIWPGWIAVQLSGELTVRPYSDTIYYLIVTAHGRTWSREIAQASVERIYPPPKDASPSGESIDGSSTQSADLSFIETLTAAEPANNVCRIDDELHKGKKARVRAALDPDGFRFECTWGHRTEVIAKIGPRR